MEEHHSWKEMDKDIDYTEIEGIIKNNIPEYDINDECYDEMYNKFYDEYGCIIIRNVFEEDVMNDYDKWCDEIYDEIKNDKNINHSIQKDKILYNNIVERMGKNNPELLFKLLRNEKLNKILDSLLGFAKIGSCTGHKILSGGQKQETHVDYPIHLNASPFWRDDGGVNKLKRLITRYQLNHVLPYFSLQALTAVCDMNNMNGSTEVVPGSHLIKDIDIKLRNEYFSYYMEKFFMSTKLKKGDVFLFNRRLCHRGGHNRSKEDRNALITQYVWSWGIGQEKVSAENFLSNNEDYEEIFKMRFNFRYPIDVSKES